MEPLYNLIATCTFGLESVLAHELRALGYTDLSTENGRVSFQGDAKAVAQCNLWLRTADRVLIDMARFPAHDFEDLFQGALAVAWEEHLPLNANMHVIGKSVKSKLHSVPACQSIVKKAMVEAMKRKHQKGRFDESGPEYRVEVSLLKDVATLTVDTSGQGLHKRGYRKQAGNAPLKETLAAGLVLLSRWRPQYLLADPLCGSGTIAIEAALIGKNRAPGLRRAFAAEEWPTLPGKVWSEAREQARAAEKTDQLSILASDVDGKILRAARQNARAAGVLDVIQFEQKEIAQFQSDAKKGFIICNPPYGERMGEDNQKVEDVYKSLGKAYLGLNAWSLFALSAYPHFERLIGRPADRKRKLYNGNILCYYYQYLH
jgi:putative N6-adenine-specific DNA methylase